ncbi:MAG: PAS domain S-box protein [Candidatus Omnitrophica bacterium]|nr:PAS domain S-box protein [Candidatus Omnitrophota bacterium]
MDLLMPIQPEKWTQIEKQFDYVKLSDKDRSALRSLAPWLLPQIPEIVDRFYEHLQSLPVSTPLSNLSEQIEKIKAAQIEYFQKILEGDFDENHIKDHKKFSGLTPKCRLGAYAFFCETLFPLLQESFPSGGDQQPAAQIALVKTFFLDIQIAIESYIYSFSEELLQTRIALENKLWLEDRLLTFILSESTDAIIGFDDQDRICTWSQGAQRIFGYKTTEILDKSLTDLVLNPEIAQNLKKEGAQQGFGALQGAFWISKSRNRIDADATLTCLTDRNGNPIGATLLIRDRTEARTMADKIKNMEQLTAMTKITASVAHEIRTPLGIIALTSDLLKNRFTKLLHQQDITIAEHEKEEISGFISDLQTEVDRLNEIVDHYLVLSRIRRPQKSPIELKPFLQAIVQELSKEKHNSGIQWELRAQDDLLVDIDAEQFRRIFHNLNDNSLHAIEGPGIIRMTAFSTDDQVQIMFQDNGAGVKIENSDNLFSAFVTHRTGGTGLGLYLVREIVEAHQGSVQIESAPGQGTAIIITLPKA